EGSGLRQGLPLRARRGGRLRRGRELPSRRHGSGAVVPADRPRAGSEDPRKARAAQEPQMIDIQTLRKDPEGVAKHLATRGPAAFDSNRFQELESRRKQLQTQVEQTQAAKNRIAKEIGQAKAKGQD